MNTIKTIDSPEYTPHPTIKGYSEQQIIDAAKAILQKRLAVLSPVMGKPSTVKDWLITHATDEPVEQFKVLWLNAQHEVLRVDVLATGTLSQASVYPREVVRAALDANAAACIVSHNHPSGVLDASRADITITDMLRKALDVIDVRLLDHIITAGGEAVSLAETGEI